MHLNPVPSGPGALDSNDSMIALSILLLVGPAREFYFFLQERSILLIFRGWGKSVCRTSFLSRQLLLLVIDLRVQKGLIIFHIFVGLCNGVL